MFFRYNFLIFSTEKTTQAGAPSSNYTTHKVLLFLAHSNFLSKPFLFIFLFAYLVTDVHSVSKRVQEQLAIMQLAEAKRNEKFTLWNSTLLEKLDAVKMKITQARHIADGVSTSYLKRKNRKNASLNAISFFYIEFP